MQPSARLSIEAPSTKPVGAYVPQALTLPEAKEEQEEATDPQEAVTLQAVAYHYHYALYYQEDCANRRHSHAYTYSCTRWYHSYGSSSHAAGAADHEDSPS